MKSLFNKFTVFVSILTLIFLNSCCWMDESFCTESSTLLRGAVKDFQDQPIESVTVKVNYLTDDNEIFLVSRLTDSEGNFEIEAPKSNKYVLNISKIGYGFTSAVFEDTKDLDSIPYDTYYLNKATVETIDASVGGTVTVTNTQSIGSTSHRADWSQIPTGTLPIVLDNSGKVAGFSMPESLKEIWTEQLHNRMSLPATRVRIPGNSLVNSSGTPAQGNVNVSISAIDVFAPGGMPGNDVARTTEGQVGTMLSYGAISIEVFDENQSYNLDSRIKAQAEISMPIPEWRLELQDEFPRTIPLLFYNEENGVWQQEGTAVLDDSLMIYTAKLSHFSSINMDIIKTDPSTTAIFNYRQTCPEPLVTGTAPNSDEIELPFKVELVIRDENAIGQPIYVRNRTVAASAMNCPGNLDDPCYLSSVDTGTGTEFLYTYAMALNRLPLESPAALTVFDGDVTKGVFVFKTSATGYSEITDGLGMVPTCDEIRNHGTGSAVAWTVDPLDLYFDATTDDFIAAVCWDGSNYYLSLATQILTFNAFDLNNDGVEDDGLAVTVSAEDLIGTEVCNDIFPLTSTNPDVEMFSNTVTDPTPGANATEWRIQVFKILNPAAFCSSTPTSNVSFTFDFNYDGTNYSPSADLADCVF